MLIGAVAAYKFAPVTGPTNIFSANMGKSDISSHLVRPGIVGKQDAGGGIHCRDDEASRAVAGDT